MSTTTVVSPVTAKRALLANTYRSVYTLASGDDNTSATINVRVIALDVNIDTKIRLAIVTDYSDGVEPDVSDYIQPKDLVLGPSGIECGVIEDTAIVLQPGETLVAYSNNGNGVCRVHGFARKVSAA